MHIRYDEDEFETVVESSPCTACNGDPKRCNGGCNGSLSVSSRRRPLADVMRIKAERRRKEEDRILVEAASIRRRRGETEGR
jgi:hypothetical protein